MSEYFRLLRRRVGLATLVIACFGAVAWVRSVALAESFMVAGFGRQLIVVSACQKLLIRIAGDQYIGVESDFESKGREFHAYNLIRPSGDPACFITTSLPATSAQTQVRIEDGSISPPLTMIPYWLIVVPLTALSAFLLWMKPRSKS